MSARNMLGLPDLQRIDLTARECSVAMVELYSAQQAHGC